MNILVKKFYPYRNLGQILNFLSQNVKQQQIQPKLFFEIWLFVIKFRLPTCMHWWHSRIWSWLLSQAHISAAMTKTNVCMYVCMYVCKGWAIKLAPTPRPSTIYCAKNECSLKTARALHVAMNCYKWPYKEKSFLLLLLCCCLFVVRTEVEGDADYHDKADVSTSNSPKPPTPSL
jgi:hypothetical protein